MTFRTVEISIIGEIKQAIYTGDIETCKYVADRHHKQRVFVINDKGNVVYNPNLR